MSGWIMAVAFLCYSGGGCEQKQVLALPKDCHAPAYHVQVPNNGRWTPATVGLRCTKGSRS